MIDIDDRDFGRAIAIGILVGFAGMFVVTTGLVLLGGLGIGLSAGIALWVGFVIGPYAGGLVMLAGVDQHAGHHEVGEAPQAPEEHEPVDRAA